MDGAWTGTTSQGQPYNFTVKGGGTIINPLKIGFSGTGISGTITFTSDIAISGNTFSASGGFCPYTTTNGTFASATTANGTVTFKFTYSYPACPASGTISAPWTAQKSLPQADLSVTKTDGKTTVVAGTSNTYIITVTNNGPEAVTSVTLTDAVPAALLSPAFTPSSGSYDPETGAWTGLSLGPGQSVTLTLTAMVSPAASGTLTNTATVSPPAGVSDPTPGNNSSSDIDTVEVVPPGPPGPASDFFTVTPCRLLDTRDPTGDYGGPALVAGQERTFVATGSKCGIPATANAVSVNLTVTRAAAQGYLSVHPAGSPLPLVSTVNYVPGLTRANNAIVPLSSSGEFTIYCGQASGTAHAIVDVNGYFQ